MYMPRFNADVQSQTQGVDAMTIAATPNSKTSATKQELIATNIKLPKSADGNFVGFDPSRYHRTCADSTEELFGCAIQYARGGLP